MTELLHQHLRENAQELLDNKGNISCPASYLNKETKMTILLPASNEWAISCLQVCGAIFPRWKYAAVFKKNGAKLATSNCPCNSSLTLIIDGEWVRVGDVFWAYVDRVLEREPKQEQDMSPNW